MKRSLRRDQQKYKNVLAKLYGGYSLTGRQGPAGRPDVAGVNKAEMANIDMGRFQEVLKGYSKASDVISGRQIDNLLNIQLEGNSSLILNLKR